jgi:1-acyl-sn-glycerol-3-phosphate acyltransferase
VKAQENLAKIDWSRPVVVIANHNSYADIPILLASAQRRLGFLAKIELSFIPVLSYWMRKIGCIFINRQAAGAGQKFMDKVSNYSEAEPPQIVIFPEGTRSKTGEMGAWKSGAFRMAEELKAAILPIALQDTVLAWEKRASSKTIQRAVAQILPPIDVAELAKNGEDINAKTLMANSQKLFANSNIQQQQQQNAQDA